MTSFFKRKSSEDDMKRWKDIKDRKLSLTLEQRREEYNREFTPLTEIPTWNEESKNIEDKSGNPEWEKLKREYTQDIQIQDIDLTDKVSLYQGDITKLEIDAVVNAANNSLMGGGGVDGAIHRAAGPLLKKENLNHDGCPDGEVRLSGGYNLPSKYVISTVGPQCENPRILQNCYRNSLQLALDNKIKSIAFPCISTGIYGYPNEDAALVALKTVRKFLEEHHKEFDRVIFCLFLEFDVNLYKEYLPMIFPNQAALNKKKVKTISEEGGEDSLPTKKQGGSN